MDAQKFPIAVIGGGPVGLAAVARLLERGETPILFESGAQIGMNVRTWQHVRMFSPWQYTVDEACARLLEAHGWQMPPAHDLPTGRDLLEQYMIPFSELPEVRPHIHLNAQVVAVSRRHVDKVKNTGRDESPFILHVVYAEGDEALIEARAVIDASGTWHNANPLGSGGLPAVGEKRHAQHIYYGIPDIADLYYARYAQKRVMVVGSGHSALNVINALATLKQDFPQTQILWVMRDNNIKRTLGGGENDELPARGQLGARVKSVINNGIVEIVSPFRVREIGGEDNALHVIGETPNGAQSLIVDEIIATTGTRPNLDMLRELRLELDPALESARILGPMIDPNLHSCGTVRPHGEAELRHPEHNFYIVGMKSYGRAPTFLLLTGYEQVRSVVAALVGDWEKARDVQLVLPETGVCNSDVDGEGCCTPTTQLNQAPALISLNAISINANTNPVGKPIVLDMATDVLTLETKACGCDTDCCHDGVKSTTCGCDTTCCS